MPAQNKRRRVSILSLPVVVVTGFLLVAKLAAWQRSDLIADLADCIAHGETREAVDAVSKLSAMPTPPIRVLVSAAASDEHETAEAAQVAIDKLLRRWQREIEAKQRTSTIANQLSELALLLADKRKEFSEPDHRWLESAARKILRIANKFPPKKTPLVAVHCDALLTAVGSEKRRTAADAETTSANVVDSDAASHSANSAGVKHDGSTVEPTTTGNKTDPADLKDVPIDSDRSTVGPKKEDVSSEPISSRPSLPRQVELPPMLRILPPMRSPVVSKESEWTGDTAPESHSTLPSADIAFRGQLTSVDSRELLQSWLKADGSLAALPIEQELARREFGTITKQLVAQYFSDDPRLRMRLVDRVLAQPGAGSNAWLLLLAEDADADVRLFAVTFMATSNDAVLVDKAWQLTIRDRDPRIADLAGRLRERRTGTFRR